MRHIIPLLALLLAGCGAPATETPAPVPTVPANWCRVTALSFVAFYETTDTGSARQGEVAPATDFFVRPASVQFAGSMIWGYAVSHWGGEYVEGWAVLYSMAWHVAATPENEACLFQVFAPGAVVAPPTPAQ